METLYLVFVTDSGQLTNVQLPRVDHADQFDRYKSTSDELGRYHEAGYVLLRPNEGSKISGTLIHA